MSFRPFGAAGSWVALRQERGPGLPRLPLLHLHRAKALAALGRRHDAAAALRDGLAADTEPDARTRLLVELAHLTEEPSQRDALLQSAELLAGNLVAAATARVLRRAAR